MGSWTPSLVRADAGTVRAIEEALAWALLPAPSPPVRAALSDGTVTLEGTVHHWSQRYDAERAVESLPGVSRVLNKIEVVPTDCVGSSPHALRRPLTVSEAIFTRRAVRAYTSDVVPEADVRALLQAAVRAPTSLHQEPWSFVVIQNRDRLRRYSAMATAKEPTLPPGFNIFYDAETLVVICARPKGTFVVADCWLAAQNLMLAASERGLGTCPIGLAVPVLNRPDVKAELAIPPEVTAVAPILVGVARDDAPPTPRRAPDILSWRTA
jgi:nitroreductase